MLAPPACLRASLLIVGVLCAAVGDAHATGLLIPTGAPQAPHIQRGWQLDSERVEAVIREAHALVTVTQVFRNLTAAPLEARYLFPLPHGARVSGVTVFEHGRPLEGRYLKADAARTAIESMLRAQRDPTLVSHYGKDLYEASIAALPPNGSRTVTVKYDQVLRTDAGVSEWTHAASAAIAAPPDGVEFTVQLDMKVVGPLGPLYCPHYDVRVDRGSGGAVTATLSARLRPDDPDVTLYWSPSEENVGATLLTYWPKDEQRGYFLFLAEPSQGAAVGRMVRPKAIHFVVDTSGSMAGEKLAQVKVALRRAISTLNPQDRFNIVAYNNKVTSLWESPQVFTPASMGKAVTFIEGLRTDGGANTEAALAAVLGAPAPEKDVPSVVVLVTDGRPTYGEVDPQRIIEKLRAVQPTRKTRIFTLGVGVDVNSVLLDRLSLESRAAPAYARPREDIERRVDLLCEKIRYPIFTDVSCDFGNMNASSLLPAAPPDLFRGSRVVLAGRYVTGGQVELVLRGQDGSLGHEYHYGLKAAARGQGVLSDFPARVWATRRIAALIDSIRLHGNEDPMLVDEIARLSRRFGVVTEYTLFLAGSGASGSSASDRDATLGLLRVQTPRAVGNVAWAQSKNQTLRRGAVRVPRGERQIYVPGANDRDVETLDLGEQPGVWPRVVANRTFYFRRDRGWVDATIDDPSNVDETVHRWSARFFEILRRASPAVNTRLAQAGDVLLRIANQTVHVVDGR